MARIYEYQAKKLLRKKVSGFPSAALLRRPREVEKISKDIGRQVVLKAQIWATGRFDAGGDQIRKRCETRVTAGK